MGTRARVRRPCANGASRAGTPSRQAPRLARVVRTAPFRVETALRVMCVRARAAVCASIDRRCGSRRARAAVSHQPDRAGRRLDVLHGACRTVGWGSAPCADAPCVQTCDRFAFSDSDHVRCRCYPGAGAWRGVGRARRPRTLQACTTTATRRAAEPALPLPPPTTRSGCRCVALRCLVGQAHTVPARAVCAWSARVERTAAARA